MKKKKEIEEKNEKRRKWKGRMKKKKEMEGKNEKEEVNGREE